MTFTSPLLQFGISLCMAVIAAIAITANRRSTREIISKDLRVKIWEKRANAYVELIQAINRQDVTERPSSEAILAAAHNGETVNLLTSNMGTSEWSHFEASVEVYASPEVRQLYLCWKAGISSWTWATATHVTHLDGVPVAPNPDEWLSKKRRAEITLHRARNELLWRIRSELDFQDRALPRFQVEEDQVPGVMVATFLDAARKDDLPVYDFSYIQNVSRTDRAWHFLWKLPVGPPDNVT